MDHSREKCLVWDGFVLKEDQVYCYSKTSIWTCFEIVTEMQRILCAPAYQVVFDDGEAIQLGFPTGVTRMNNLEVDLQILEEISRQKMNEYESHGSEKWDNYMRSQVTNSFNSSNVSERGNVSASVVVAVDR